MNGRIIKCRFAVAVVSAVLFAAVFPVFLRAAMPPGINYQGRYLENNVPFTGAKNNCRFKIYDHPTAGALQWGTAAMSLNFDKGLFNYVIECSTHDWRAYDSYLEVEIDGNILSPRERLQASPYAFYASSAAFAYEIPALSVDAGKLAANAVTSAKILDGTIAAADIGDRQITGAKTLITSTQAIALSQITTASNVWADMTDMSLTIDVASAPATIFAYFNCTAGRSDLGWTKTAVQFNIDGTDVGYGEVYWPADMISIGLGLGMNAIYRVTTSGAKTVKVRWRSGDDGGAYGTALARNRMLSAFVLGAP